MSSHRSASRGSVPTDLYEVLEVSRTATKDQIRQQYKRLALKYHPDKNVDGDRAHAEKMFKAVARAYEVLSDDAARRKYDLFGSEGVDGAPQEAAPRHEPSFDERRRAPAAPPQGDGFSTFSRGFGSESGFPFASSGGLFGDAFLDDFFGHSRSGGTSHHHRSTGQLRSLFDSFFFHDPFELFEQMFHQEHLGEVPRSRRTGGQPRPAAMVDPLMEFMMGGGGLFGALPHRSSGALSRDVIGFGDMDPFFGGRGFFGGGQGGSFFSSSSSFGGGGGGRMQSVSQVTEVRNGQRVTKTIRRTQDERGVVTEDVDEEVEELPHVPAPRRVQAGLRALPSSVGQQTAHRGVYGERPSRHHAEMLYF